MPFTKGVSGNIYARPFKTPNKLTQDYREFIKSIIDKQKNKIEIELDQLKEKANL